MPPNAHAVWARNNQTLHVRFYDLNHNMINWATDPAGNGFHISIDDGAGTPVVVVSGISTHGLAGLAPGVAYAANSPAAGAYIPGPAGAVKNLHFTIRFPAVPTPGHAHGGVIVWEGRDLRAVPGQAVGDRAGTAYVCHIYPMFANGHPSRNLRMGYNFRVEIWNGVVGIPQIVV
ncbi:hypothetical protein HDU86_002187 [Geranomyces michiganensis]|nr:hypothetical protein HDU86_002187 [Geranomyces michiganensis]